MIILRLMVNRAIHLVDRLHLSIVLIVLSQDENESLIHRRLDHLEWLSRVQFSPTFKTVGNFRF